ncbi:hypothetical protein F511_24368 [Dorcoceras hygrometricum]|uniref:Uncharacterized protein n=1 Tax=Dorcoceras hygrometricum TaxID=472368 RepID=A0A2Z7ALU7_9LAMI|nr:hypothetical protein F511_24368 [Dorcoceras hygrometricum]
MRVEVWMATRGAGQQFPGDVVSDSMVEGLDVRDKRERPGVQKLCSVYAGRGCTAYSWKNDLCGQVWRNHIELSRTEYPRRDAHGKAWRAVVAMASTVATAAKGR